MASRYWVGGALTTNWSENTAGITNWATTSGGAGIAAIPTSADDVFFDATSGSGASVIDTAFDIQSFDCTGATIALTHNLGVNLTISGAGATIKFVAGMTYILGSATTSAIIITSASGTVNLTTAGKTLGNLTINGANPVVTLQDALTMGSTATFTLTDGQFAPNGKNISCGFLSSANTNSRTFVASTTTWTLTGNAGTVIDFSTATNLTFTSTNYTFSLTYAGSTGTRTLSCGSVNIGNLNIAGGTDTVQFTTVDHINIDWTGFAGTFTGSTAERFTGTYTLSSGMTFSYTGGLTVNGNSTHTFTTNGKTISYSNINMNMGTGAFSVSGALTSTGTIQLTMGTFTTNNFNISCTRFLSTNANTRTVNFGTSTITVTGTGNVIDMATITGLTFNVASSTIKVTNVSATAKTISSGGLTFGNIWFTGAGTGTFDIVGSNTFADFKVDTPPHTIRFTAGTTTTVTTFTVSGTVGNLMTIGSITAASHALVKAGGGIISRDYLSISRSDASPATTWYAGNNSTDGGNNTGWIFRGPSIPNSLMMMGVGV